MYIEGISGDKQFQKDAEDMSKYFLAGILKYQMARADQDGKTTTYAIYAGAMFTLGVVVKDLPRRERNRLREFMIDQFDEFMKEHGAR